MNKLDSSLAESRFCIIDGLGNLILTLDMVDFYIDHSQTDANVRSNFLERFKIILWPVCQLKDKVIRMEGIEKLEKRFPFPGLYGLSTIVSKAEMNGPRTIKGIEHPVYCLRSDRPVLRASGNIRLINLQARARKPLDLFSQDIGNGKCQGIEVPVMIVKEGARKHVRARYCKLEGTSGHTRGASTVLDKIESTPVKRFINHGSGLGTKPHLLLGPERLGT